MRVFVASGNAGKLSEMRAIFAGSPFELETYAEYRSPAEDAPDYFGNALHKARTLQQALCRAGVEGAVLADDSGLEVEGLGGRPGVHSARYAGAATGWPDRRAALLRELDEVAPDRRDARFACTMVLLDVDGALARGVGDVRGRIAQRPSGADGFGYDPVFFHPPSGRTFAELSFEEKNAISHRRAAADALLADWKRVRG